MFYLNENAVKKLLDDVGSLRTMAGGIIGSHVGVPLGMLGGTIGGALLGADLLNSGIDDIANEQNPTGLDAFIAQHPTATKILGDTAAVPVGAGLGFVGGDIAGAGIGAGLGATIGRSFDYKNWVKKKLKKENKTED